MSTPQIKISAVIFLLGFLACGGIFERKDNQHPLTFCNPLNLEYRFTRSEPSRRMAADPVIVLFQDTYFLFSTGSSEYWYSSDLADWILIPEEISDLPDRPTAPAVTVVDDAVYFIPSSRDSSLFYKSTDPKSGKWELAKKSIPGWDPALFYDEDGSVYYYWGCSNKNPIRGVELDKFSLEPKCEIEDFFKGNKDEHGWERRGDNHELPNPAWIEGPWMTKHKDTYYLQYAAPGTEFKSYADGVYTSKSPLGPFNYEPYSPFSHKPGGFIGGAGHGATFQDKYGNYWRVITMVVSVLDMFERRLGIFPAGFDKDGVMYTNTLLGDFPQIMPTEKRDPFANNLAGWMLLSYGKKSNASSSISGQEPKLAFDENVKTWWSAETSNRDEWIKVDLGKVCTVNAVQVNFAEHNSNLFGRRKSIYHQYTIEYSNDDQDWKTLIDKSKNLEDVPHDYIRLSQAVKIRFVKLSNIQTPGDGPFAVRDFRLFGNGQGKVPQEAEGLTVDRDSGDRRSARITWNKSKDAFGYVIRYGITPEKLYDQYQVMDETELKVNSLNRDISYYFAIDAFNENGYAKGTDIIESK